MKKIIRLTERDLTRLVKRVIIENEEEGWVDFFPLYREKFQDNNDNDKELIGKKVKVYNKDSDKHDLPGKIIGRCDDGYGYQIMLNSGKETCSNPRDFLIKKNDFDQLSEPNIIEKFNDKLKEKIMKSDDEKSIYELLIKFLDNLDKDKIMESRRYIKHYRR